MSSDDSYQKEKKLAVFALLMNTFKLSSLYGLQFFFFPRKISNTKHTISLVGN